MGIRRARALMFVVVFLLPSVAAADFQIGVPVHATQPNGNRLELRASGDEFYQLTGTIDGYTVTRDPVDGWICYAKLSADGMTLIPTQARVGSADPKTLGLPTHLSITDDARRAIVESRRERLDAALRDRWMALGSPAKAVSTGDRVGVTLLVDFSDEPGTIPPAEVDDYCNRVGYDGYGNNGSVRDYFFDVSGGQLTYTNQVTSAYYRAEHPKSWYEDTEVPYAQRARILVLEALDALEASGFDFGTCDADADGIIDAINIFYAGFRGGTWAAGLWPHAGAVTFSADGVRSYRYQMTDIRTTLSLSTFCHENGHMVCAFPDLYDYGGESRGVGAFCLMCRSWSSLNPIEFCAPLKRLAGWTTDHELVADETGLTAYTGSSDVYVYPNHNKVTDFEYYVIENRQQTGRDEALPDAGLAIWHVDERGSNNHEQMTPEQHYKVTLVQADGLWELEHGINSGDADDLWKSTAYSACTPFTDPATTWWSDTVGRLSGLAIVNISGAGPAMTFDYEAIDWSDDCNYNGVSDALDISVGTSDDANGNGVPDECEWLLDDIQAYDPVTGYPVSPFTSQDVTVTGVVYAAQGPVATEGPYLTDGSGGILYVVESGGALAVGDIIRLTAEVMPYPFGTEIVLSDEYDGAFEILGHGPEPSPQVLAIGDLLESYEIVGGFVEITGNVLGVLSDLLVVEQDGAAVIVFAAEAAGVDTSYISTGSTVTVRGACRKYDREVRVWLRGQSDLAVAKVDEPVIVDIEDVAADQGGQVRLRWVRSLHDETGSLTPVTEYTVCRWDEMAAPAGAVAAAAESWTVVASVPATGAEFYTMAVPTLADSTITSGQAYSTFLVRAETGSPATYFESAPYSGYSVDNLAPAAPQDIAAAYAHDGVDLAWDAATEADFLLHRIYRSTDSNFEPPAGTLVQETATPAWTDTVSDPWHDHYKITTVDQAGNESAAGAPTSVTDAGAREAPARTALLGAVPNPFNSSTQIRFALAAPGRALLTIYDASGRRVATLVDGPRGAGPQHVPWSGLDAAGRSVASGVYFCRLEAHGHYETVRMVLLK